jgi:hypothetical protein
MPVEEELIPDEEVNVLDQSEGSGVLQDGAEIGKLHFILEKNGAALYY